MSNEPNNSWPKVTLRDLIERNFSGPSPTCEERNIGTSNEWGLLKTTAITWSGWDERAHKVPPKPYWNNPSIEVHSDDVLVTKAGPRHRVGVVVHVRDTRPHLMVSGKMVGLRPRTHAIIPSILAGLLSTREPQDYLNSRTTGMAESQTNFADEALLQTPLRVPPLPEQRRIAKILDTLDDQIRATEQIIAKLKVGSKGVLSNLVGPGATGTQSCRQVLLADLVNDIRYGTSAPSTPAEVEGGVPVLRIPNVQSGRLDLQSLQTQQPTAVELDRYGVSAEDVLVIRTNGNPELLGRCAYVLPGLGPFLFASYLIRIRFDTSRVIPLFAAYYLNSEAGRSHIESVAATSAGNYNLNMAQLRAMPVALPDLRKQAHIVKILRAQDRRIDDEIRRLSKLRALKNGLMSDLLNGRVRVPVEPTS